MTTRRAVSVALVPLFFGACATASIEDAVPEGALAGGGTQTVHQQEPAQAFSTPGDYPNLNINPPPAAEQLTDAQRNTQAAALRARRQQQAGSAQTVPDRSEELRRLARSHADDTLREIEAE